MKFIRANNGTCYTPEGHDAEVTSCSIYKGEIDVHTTIFPAGAGMVEEIHEQESHVFFMLEGKLEVRQNKKVLKVLEKGDSVYISAGEFHEIRNNTEKEAVFLAITFTK